MEGMLNYRQGESSNELIIFDSKRADVDGDGKIEKVSLVGTISESGIVASNIKITISNDTTYDVNLKTNKGYNPKLFLGDFTSDGLDDVFVSMESGNTGREGFFYIYSFALNNEQKIFDYEVFNNKYKYDVTYDDNYIVRVTSLFSPLKYMIDISNKGHYLNALYKSDGSLKRPTKGMVSPIIELRTIKDNNHYNLQAIQRIIGYYNADTLGMIVTPLSYDKFKNEFVSMTPYLI